ncbi:uncharacterized protein LOC116209413 [Punica granatum]|uniref:Uncharacterized protein LOC116209413 n=1 Tax=Punica granatum TaxID=22663 RepID=A0A6P8DX05_PUNGR|nr:uncharacterized protein LOC116209413 [Punica granatum]
MIEDDCADNVIPSQMSLARSSPKFSSTARSTSSPPLSPTLRATRPLRMCSRLVNWVGALRSLSLSISPELHKFTTLLPCDDPPSKEDHPSDSGKRSCEKC